MHIEFSRAMKTNESIAEKPCLGCLKQLSEIIANLAK